MCPLRDLNPVSIITRGIGLATMAAWTVALLLATPKAFAADGDMIARQGDDQAVITPKPCTDKKVLDRLNPEVVGRYRAATARFNQQYFSACWRPMGTSVFLLYEDGDQGLIPMTAFAPVPEV